jgi:PTH1 family peptidyl-tRNA hydrolase
MVLDALAGRLNAAPWREKDSSQQTNVLGDTLLVKPMSFMNDSGIPLGRIIAWHKVPLNSLLVVSDDLDLPFGRLRMRVSGGHGGHNGLRSIIEAIGPEFSRLRMGIGRGRNEAIEHVLTPFSAEEFAELPPLVALAVSGIELWLESGPSKAMQYLNSSVFEKGTEQNPSSTDTLL